MDLQAVPADPWTWGPTTITAVATVVTAAVAIAGFVYAIVERRRVERPDVSGVSTSTTGSAGSPRLTRTVEAAVRNPSRRTMQLLSVTIEEPADAGFLAGERDPEELLHDLAGVVRRAGREFHDMVRLATVTAAGSA